MNRQSVRLLVSGIVAALALLANASPAWPARATPKPAVPAPNPALTPRLLTIQTVPAVVGARFALDGRILVTGRDGTVRTTTTRVQRDALAQNRDAHLSVASPTIAIRQGVRARFAGWYDGGYHYSNTDKTGQILRAAFDFEFLTSFSFTRPNGTVVAPGGLGAMQLHGGAGGVVALAKIAPVWLTGIKVVSTGGHLGVNDVEYKISSVKMNGNNVVYVDQQRFTPSHRQHVVVQLLLFTVTLQTHDAFFGFNSGSAVDLECADGTVLRSQIRRGSVTLTDLPRGDYALTLHAPGLTSDKSLSISRNQTVTLQVISWIDIVVGLALLLVIAAALVLIGRSRRHGRFAARSASVSRAPEELVLEPSAPAQ